MSAAPSVTVLIPTYARTELLVEAVYSALIQDYKGAVDVLVVNDVTRQHLQCYNERVQVVNLPERTGSLGEKREMMVHMAQGDWVAFLDDDDLLMPWYLSSALNAIDGETQAVFPTMEFRLNGRGTGRRWSLGEVPGGINLMVKRSLAKQIPFERIDVGEDNMFRNAVKARVGRNCRLVGSAARVYRVDAPVFHISRSFVGAAQNRAPFTASAENRMDSGIEPTGVVTILPQWKEDYWRTVASIFPHDVPKHP